MANSKKRVVNGGGMGEQFVTPRCQSICRSSLPINFAGNGTQLGLDWSCCSEMAIFIKRALVGALGVFLGSALLPGIEYEGYGALTVAAILLSVFSAILKPVLVLFTLPFVVLTMGLGLLVINALLFSFTSFLVDGFHVESFGYAFLGALIVTMLNFFFGSRINPVKKGYSKVKVNVNPGGRGTDGARRQAPGQTRGIKENEDVIDI